MTANAVDRKLYIQNAGDTDWLEVNGLGDITVTTGKSAEGKVTKSGTMSYVQPAVAMVEFEVNLSNPPATSDTQLLALHASSEVFNFKVEDAVAGGRADHGTGRLALSSIGDPVEGISTATGRIVVEGAITTGTSPIAYPS